MKTRLLISKRAEVRNTQSLQTAAYISWEAFEQKFPQKKKNMQLFNPSSPNKDKLLSSPFGKKKMQNPEKEYRRCFLWMRDQIQKEKKFKDRQPRLNLRSVCWKGVLWGQSPPTTIRSTPGCEHQGSWCRKKVWERVEVEGVSGGVIPELGPCTHSPGILTPQALHLEPHIN